jgi:hypothetical protein
MLIPPFKGELSPIGAADIRGGIYYPSVFMDFEMDMRTGGPPEITRESDDLTFFDDVTGIQQNFLVVGIDRLISIAMINLNQLVYQGLRGLTTVNFGIFTGTELVAVITQYHWQTQETEGNKHTHPSLDYQ